MYLLSHHLLQGHHCHNFQRYKYNLPVSRIIHGNIRPIFFCIGLLSCKIILERFIIVTHSMFLIFYVILYEYILFVCSIDSEHLDHFKVLWLLQVITPCNSWLCISMHKNICFEGIYPGLELLVFCIHMLRFSSYCYTLKHFS